MKSFRLCLLSILMALAVCGCGHMSEKQAKELEAMRAEMYEMQIKQENVARQNEIKYLADTSVSKSILKGFDLEIEGYGEVEPGKYEIRVKLHKEETLQAFVNDPFVSTIALVNGKPVSVQSTAVYAHPKTLMRGGGIGVTVDVAMGYVLCFESRDNKAVTSISVVYFNFNPITKELEQISDTVLLGEGESSDAP